MNDQSIQVMVPKKLAAYVRAQAKRERMSSSAFVRRLIEGHEFSFRGGDTHDTRLARLEEKIAKFEAWYQLHGARF